jgi:hypothetical protein
MVTKELVNNVSSFIAQELEPDEQLQPPMESVAIDFLSVSALALALLRIEENVYAMSITTDDPRLGLSR